MSRVGKQLIKLPAGIKTEINGNVVKIEGPKGKLSHILPMGVSVKVDNNLLSILRDDSVLSARALHGLSRTLVHNMCVGVTQGFSKELEIVGVGYRAQTKGNTLSLSLGYSHPVEYKLPEGIQAKVENNTKITVSGADKMLVGLVAAKIRAFKEPEPYQGKGVRYLNEVIIRKQGKAAGAGAK